MRVRIFEVGNSRSTGVYYADRFPCTLNVNDQGGLADTGTPVCELEDVGGEIKYTAIEDERFPITVNDAPLTIGPLIPGDRLEVGNHRFMISYERTAVTESCDRRYRIQG